MPRSPRSRIGTLQRSWDDYYEPQVGISADSARYVRHRAARSFTECLARMFPLVEFRGRSLPIQNEGGVLRDLEHLLDRILNDQVIIAQARQGDAAKTIAIKFAPLLHEVEPARSEWRAQVPR